MINTNKFYIYSDAMKLDKNGHSTLDVYSIVKSVVRHKELEVVLNKKIVRDAKKLYKDAHVDGDAMTALEEDCKIVLGNNFEEFWKARQEIEALQEECEHCLPLDMYTSLGTTDKIHILLMAHTIYKNISFDDVIFDSEKGGVDITKAIIDYYKSNQKKTIKTSLATIFHKLFSEEGEYFYPVKVRKSSFKEEDINHFLANFGGDASRKVKENKKKNNCDYSKYIWTNKAENKNIQTKAFSDLCAVILDNPERHEVIKPDGTKSEFEQRPDVEKSDK